MRLTLDALRVARVYAKELVQMHARMGAKAGARAVAKAVVKADAEHRVTLLVQTAVRMIVLETVARIAAFRVKGFAFKNARTTVLAVA
jgi:hypothetical protein